VTSRGRPSRISWGSPRWRRRSTRRTRTRPPTKAFADWFYDIGEQLGLLDPEDGDDDGGIDGDDDDPDSGGGDVAELRGLVEQLQARLEQAEAAPRIQSEQQRIDKQLATAIEKHHLAATRTLAT
jgi:hypothetical protein